MATCPNKNLDSWKKLVAEKGEDMAYYLWYTNDGDISKLVSPGEIKVLNGNEDLYKKYNLLNKEGRIKTFLYNTVDQVKKINAFVNSLNKSPYYSFSVKKTPSGHKIFIHDKGMTNQQVSRGDVDLALKNKYFPDSDVVESYDILEKIANSNHPLNKLANHLLKYVSTNNVNIELVNKLINNRLGEVAGEYYYESNNIKINKNARFDKLGSETTLLHEIIHSLSARELASNSEVTKEFRKLYEYALKFIPAYNADTKEGEYAMYNLDEFMTGIFTDDRFIKKLMEISPMKSGNKFSDFYNQILDYIYSLFEIKRDDNLYTQAFSVANAVLQQSSDFRKESEYVERYAKESREVPIDQIIKLSKDLFNRLDVDLKSMNIVKGGVKQTIDDLSIIGAELVKLTSKKTSELTQQAMEFAVNMIQEKNPKLFNELLKNINNYNELKNLFIEYNNSPEYKTADGKPDIIKIKKKAIANVLTKTLINDEEGTPELTENLDKSIKMLSDVIEYSTEFFKTSGFDKASMSIIKGEFDGDINQLRTQMASLQADDWIKNAVDSAVDKAIDVNSRMKLVPATGNLKRHYTFDGIIQSFSVTEFIKRGKEFFRTDEQKLDDDYKKAWGSEGHDFLDKISKKRFLDENGYIKDVYTNDDVPTQLNIGIQDALMQYLTELFDSYKANDALRTDGARTRILTEKMVVNTKKKGGVASTIDFQAFIPDDKVGVKIDTLDWKFVNIDTSRDEDIPWYKRDDWNKQMNQYVMMYKTDLYGLKPENIGKARMIPFMAKYVRSERGNASSPLYLNSVEIGKVDSSKETNIYLLPVPITSETTNNQKIDGLLKALRVQYEKMYSAQLAGGEEQFEKNLRLNQFSMAIRSLHVKLDFEPLASAGQIYIADLSKILKNFKGIDYSTMSVEDINAKMGQLINFESAADKFTKLDDIFLSKFDTYELSEEDEAELSNIRKLAFDTKDVLKQIKQLYDDYTVYLAEKSGVVNEDDGLSILDAEREVETLGKSFLEASKLSPLVIRLASNLIMKARNLMRIKVNRVIDDYTTILNKVEKEANAKGKTAFEMVATIKDGNMRLMSELSADFWKAFDAAKENEDKNFFLKNMDRAKYDKLVAEYVTKSIENIRQRTFIPNDSEKNQKVKEARILKIKKSLEIDNIDFDGFNEYKFREFFIASMNKNDWYSDDFKQLMNSPNALALWNFFRELNLKAKRMGYLSEKEALSFFPVVQESFLKKLQQSGNFKKESMDFFKNFYEVREEEEQRFSKLDPETNKIRRVVPKYFMSKDQEITKLSKDMNKVGILWINALMQYETSKGLENTLLVLHKVQDSKGSIIVDENNNIVYDDRGVPKVDVNNKSTADILMTMIDDHIYGLQENENSWGNIKLTQALDKVTPNSDKKEVIKINVKKGMSTINSYIQSLAVGLKASIAIPNWFGYNFQAYINGGRFYTFKDFTKNNIKSTTGIGFTIEEKGIIDILVPLNEDLSKEKIRHNAKEQSYTKWLESWNFTDVMMVSNSWPERKLQIANAMSFVDNSTIIDGKIVNIRQYLMNLDSITKYKLSEQDRITLEKSLDSRVEQMIKDKSLAKLVRFENDRLVIPGVSDESLADFRTTIVEYGRNLNGQMSEDNKADYRRDAIFKSFMMFRNWMPKQISIRALDINKNAELGIWEYGRSRLFMKTILHLGAKNVLKMRSILNGTDEGLTIMRELLENKKEEYLKKHGKELKITEEEFFDLVRTELSNQMKELRLLLSLMAIVAAAGFAVDDDDDEEDLLAKNQLKFLAKLINKTSDEVSFYYNPLSFQSMTNGSLLPALGVTNKIWSVIKYGTVDIYGFTTDDEQLMKKTHSLKALFDMIPILSQFQRELLPIIDPELAKEMGIKPTAESRQGR
jgi:hypothetical protein